MFVFERDVIRNITDKQELIGKKKKVNSYRQTKPYKAKN